MRCYRQPRHNLLSHPMLAMGQVLSMRVLSLQDTWAILHAELFFHFFKEADQSCLPLCVSWISQGGDGQYE